MYSPGYRTEDRLKVHLYLIRVIGVIVPQRLRLDWRQEWEAELRHREALLENWANLNWRTKLDLLRRSLGAFRDALMLQPRRLEDEMIQDLRFGLRMLVNNPGFTILVVIMLSLGIGANTAIFTAVDAALLNPLPYQNPDRLVQVWETRQSGEIKQMDASYPDYLDWGQPTEVIDGICGYTGWGGSFTLTGRGDSERIEGSRVTASFFPVLGVEPMLGRSFLPDEDKPGAAATVILSYGLWQRRFGGDPAILGQQLTLDGKGYTVLGVMPRSFQFAPAGKADLWVPLRPSQSQSSRRFMHWLDVVVRLKPGISREQAETRMGLVAAQIERDDPESHTGAGLKLVPLHEQIIGSVRPLLLVLLGAVTFVLLIACANVANLLLVRAAARRREIAIRLALGVTRWRLVRQLTSESLLLTLLGGAAGLIVSVWSLKLLIAAIPAAQLDAMPYLQGLTLNARVLAFTGVLSLVTGIVFGLAPAWQSSNLDLQSALKASSRTSTGRQRLRGLLVVSETALAFMLVVGAGLMIKSTFRLLDVKLGFRPEKLLTMQLDLPPARYAEDEQVRAFHQQTLTRIKELPGVVDAGTVNWLPMQPGPVDLLLIEGEPAPPASALPKASTRVISSNYFHTMGISLLEGRSFSDRDNSSSPGVIIINNALAHRLFGEQDPLGRRVSFAGEEPRPIEIVGVVDDERIGALDEEAEQVLYRPFLQQPWAKMTLVIRTAGDPQSLINSVRGEVQGIDHDLALYSSATMEQVISDMPSTFMRRYPALLLSVFAVLALTLAGVGIYGVVSYTVSQRAHEIGIRVALGAKTRDVIGLVVRQGLRLALIGIAVGVVAAFTMTRLLEGLLFSVSPTDPMVLIAVSGTLIGVALLACLLPARRATNLQPMVALRRE